MAETILFAIALKFALLPLLGWCSSLLALRGRPSGARSVVGVSGAFVAALGSAYFAYVFDFDGAIAWSVIGGGTVALVIAHLGRFASARRLRRAGGPPGANP